MFPFGDLAQMVCAVAGFEGCLTFDTTKPDGTPRKLMDVSRMHGLGWHHRISLAEGISRVYAAVQNQL